MVPDDPQSKLIAVTREDGLGGRLQREVLPDTLGYRFGFTWLADA